VPLTSFVVVRDHHAVDNSVLVQSFDGPQVILTFISHATIENYFERNLARDQCNFLIDRNLEDIERLISDKYDRSLTTRYVSASQIFPRIDVTLDDLRSIPGRLTDSVLGVAAGANFGGRPLLFHLADFQLVPERDQLTGFVLLTCRAGDQMIEVSVPRQDLDAVASSRGWGRGPLAPSTANYLVGANLDTLAPIIEARYNRGEVSQHTSLVFHRIMPLVELTRADLERGITRPGRRAIHTSPVPGALVVDGIELIPELMPEPTKLHRKRPPRSVEQRPAAYRFIPHGDKIDVLPEPPEPLDRQLAEDTHQELLTKARDLLLRLQRSNAASRVRDSVQRLKDALDVRFDELRPGVLLSRVRSLEADRAAYDTEEARAELFSDALARMDDTVQSARDLLAVFPKVRQIEAERLALDLDRRPDVLPVIEQQANEIQDAAQRSGAATENAVRALAQNDAAINAATNNSVLRNSLIADKLLVIGNFARAAAGKVWSELSELGADSWEAVKENLPKGIGTAARVGPLMALMTLATLIAGPVAGVASAVPAWKPFSRVFKKMVGDGAKNLERMPRPKAPTKVAKERISQKDLLFLVLDRAREHGIVGINNAELRILSKNGDWAVSLNRTTRLSRNAAFYKRLSSDEKDKWDLFIEDYLKLKKHYFLAEIPRVLDDGC
jgi:hypothetical protein